MDEHQTTPHAHPPFDADAAKGFLGSLLDLSFKSFVTPKVIQLLFLLLLIGAGLWTIAVIAGAFANGTAVGVIVLVLSPIILLICILFIRMYLELVIVLFRIYELIRDRPL